MADDLKKSKQPKQNQIKNKKSKQPKTNKNKNNGCGTAPGNLVPNYFPFFLRAPLVNI